MSQAPTKRDLDQLPELNDTKAEADRLTAANEQLKKEIAERSGAEDRIRLIIDTIPVMAWSVRPDGIVDFLNQRWTDYTGLSLGQYVAVPTGPIHPEDGTTSGGESRRCSTRRRRRISPRSRCSSAGWTARW